MTTGPRTTSTSHLLLFIAALGGVAMALLGIMLFAALAVFAVASGDVQSAWLPLWTVAGLFVLIAALAPGLYWFGRAALGGSVPPRGRPSAAWLALVVAYPVCLASGGVAFAASGTPGPTGVAGLIGTAVIPVVAVAWIVRRLGPPLTPTRAWGHFTMGITAIPLAALIVEFIALLPLVLAGGLWLLGSPEAQQILSMMDPATGPDPEALTQLSNQLLTSPVAIAGAYGFLALVIPIVEEVIKSMAVWPFLRRGLAPAEAFLGGALGGAGYALFEALFLAQPGEAWLMTTIARTGATFLHAFTAALTGWGLMEGVRRKRYGVMIGAFAAALTMHAAWNAAAVTIGIGSVPLDSGLPSAFAGAAAGAPVLLAGLIVVSVVGLTAGWKRLEVQPVPPPG